MITSKIITKMKTTDIAKLYESLKSMYPNKEFSIIIRREPAVPDMQDRIELETGVMDDDPKKDTYAFGILQYLNDQDTGIEKAMAIAREVLKEVEVCHYCGKIIPERIKGERICVQCKRERESLRNYLKRKPYRIKIVQSMLPRYINAND